MTWALCFSCGQTKFGAICACEECGVSSSGDMELDILFSDHNYSAGTLEQFGQVIKSINNVSHNQEDRFSAFIYYVSLKHPEILTCDLEEDKLSKMRSILALANPPDVVVAGPEDNLEDIIQ